MQRQTTWFLVLGWLAWALTLSPSARAEPSSHGELTVVVVRAGTLDWPEARQAVEAELTATGFRVRTRQSTIVTPGALIDELRRAGKATPEVRGSVSVFREAGEGRAYVWLPERDNLLQVNAPLDGEPMPAQILSLRVVELLRVRLLDEPPSSSPPTPPLRGLSAAWVGAGPWLDTGLDRPMVQFGLGASLRVADSMEFDLSGGLSVVGGHAKTPAGTIALSASSLSAHALWLAHRSLERRESGFELALGGGAGAMLLEASARGRGAYVGRSETATLASFSARVRALYRLHGFAVVLTVEPGITLPELSASTGAADVFHFGQPLLSTSLGVGWAR